MKTACTVTILFFATAWASANSAKSSCRTDGQKVIDISITTPAAGDTVAGPCTVVVKDLNVARYDYTFSSTITFASAPDLWSQLTALAAPAPSNAASQKVSAPSDTSTDKSNVSTAKGKVTEKLSAKPPKGKPGAPTQAVQKQTRADIVKLLDAAQQELDKVDEVLTAAVVPVNRAADLVDAETRRYNIYQALRRQAAVATSSVSDGGRSLNLFLTQSDSDLKQGGYARLMQDVSSVLQESSSGPPIQTDSTVVTGTKAIWPKLDDAANVRKSIEDAAPGLQAAIIDFTNFKNTQDQALSAVRDQLTATRESLRTQAGKVSDDEATQIKIVTITIGEHIADIDNQRSVMTTKVSELASSGKRDGDILTGLADLEPTSKSYSDFRAAQDALISWRNRLSSIRTVWSQRTGQSDPFAISFFADCEFAFSRTKTTVVQLAKTDKMPGSAAGAVTIPLVTVECTSPFSISAGVAFSTIGEREFAIQPVATPPGSTTTQNRFVETSNSNVHPLPLGMVHVRVWEPWDSIAIHGSFGLAGNLRGQASGGSNAEFLLGPSISFFRTFFLTPGLYFGQKVSLAGGYTANGLVPPSVTQPPLEKSYKPAFAFAVTFTKP